MSQSKPNDCNTVFVNSVKNRSVSCAITMTISFPYKEPLPAGRVQRSNGTGAPTRNGVALPVLIRGGVSFAVNSVGRFR